MKLALVDLFGDAVETEFEINFIDNVPSHCANIVLSQPIIADQVYIVGDTQKDIQV